MEKIPRYVIIVKGIMKEYPDINTLLGKMISGDESAWKSFLEKFHPLIQGTVNKYISYPEAEDIANEVYVHLMEDNYRLLRNFHGEFPGFLLYIQSISKNISRKEGKKYYRKNNPLRSINDEFEPVDSRFSIEMIFEENQSKENLNIAIENLELTYIEVLKLRSEGYKAKEIAKILSIPLNTVLTKMSRGKKKLKNHLQGEIKI